MKLNQYRHVIRIKILGTILELRCKYEQCMVELKEFFAVKKQVTSLEPDIIIYCDYKKIDRYLFRTRPQERKESALEGVYFQLPGSSEVYKWESLNPPLIPFEYAPMAQQFVAIHAGAIKNEKNEAILFIGKSGSGKTTSTLRMVKQNDTLQFLTDETVFCRTRSIYIEPFPRLVLPRKMENGEIVKERYPANQLFNESKIANTGAIIKYIFFLDNTKGAGLSIDSISKEGAFRNILEHYQFAGTGMKDSIRTLHYIVEAATCYQVHYKEFSELISFIDNIPSYLAKKEGVTVN